MSIVTIPNAVNPATPFTPGLTFGGAAVGMTFAGRSGYYIKSGSLVWFKLEIQLTAKGSSTGLAVVTGMPFTADTLGSLHCAVAVGYADGLSSVSGGISAIVAQGATTIAVYQTATGTTAQLTNANFTNTSRLIISGLYSV
jgi:hypothetical protein